MTDTTVAEQKQTLLDIVCDIRIAMMATLDTEGQLRSRPMACAAVGTAGPGGELWFFTRAPSPKTDEIVRYGAVNLAFADADAMTFLSVSGTAEIVRDTNLMKEFWRDILKTWFPQGTADPELALLRIDISKAEYWDGATGEMADLEAQAPATRPEQPYHMVI